jgi:hypothetical protein
MRTNLSSAPILPPLPVGSANLPLQPTAFDAKRLRMPV